MGLHITTDDLARCEAASRAMLSPLAAASVDDWRRDVNRTVRELFRGDETIFMLPKGERLFFSEEAPDVAAGVEAYITDYTTAGIRVSDPVVDFWQHLRRQEHLEVFSWAANAQMIGAYGHAMRDSDMVAGVLMANRVQDFTGCFVTTPIGEVLLWVLFERNDRARFGDASMALVQALLPSFKAGLDALLRFDAQRVALDQLSDAVVVYGADRRELHRNAALLRLCEADPEHPRLLSEVARLAYALYPLGFGRTGHRDETALAPGQRSVVTAKARYALRGTLLPPGAFSNEAGVMITVVKRGGPELPGPEVLRERYGLTVREAEVALHLAEGRSNDEIADRLFLSPHTARRHTANIFDKLGVNTRKGLALTFLQA
jgi:DNA-binding CsgD family transcriptional regulator